MTKSMVRKILFVILLIVMMFAITSNAVFAAVTIPTVDENTSNESEEDEGDGEEVPVVNIPSSTPINSNVNTNKVNESTLPKTGETTDYIVMGLIAVAATSAIYAYNKTKKYRM